ncbi:MAG: hypothetical protein ABIN18_03800 [Pseudomonadota bacterium]
MANEITPNSNTLNETQFRLDDRQRLIYERLNRLVGVGAATFYHDACRHIATKPPFAASTHIVGHLLREVESALRDVLESLTGPIEKTKKSNEHENEVKVILKALDIDEFAAVSQAWLQLTGDDALHSRAHRRNLEPVRPINKGFYEFWYQMQTVLDIILDRFEAQYTKVFSTLDTLALKAQPTKTDAQIVHLHIPNNFVAHQKFFNQLINPKWLPLLKDEGIFSEPPEPEYNPADQTTRHFPWPVATYLEKMASVEPDLITDILKNIKGVDNFNVKNSLIKITTNLPKKNRIELLDKAKNWVKTEHQIFQLTLLDSTNDLINKYIEDGEENAAFELAFILLEILPDTKKIEQSSEEKQIYRPRRKPQTLLESWHYNEFLRKKFKKLIELNPKRSFDLVCSLLQDYLKIEHEDEKDHEYEDRSYISRPAIEDHKQNHNYGNIKNELITAVRDIGLQMVKKKPATVKNLFAELEARKWALFRRIGFYLLGEVPDATPDLVAKQLTNQTFFDNSHVKHEYARLMRVGFRTLNKKDQDLILGWIDKAEWTVKRFEGYEKELGESASVSRKERWQRDQLSYIKDDLPATWRIFYDDLIKKYGEPKHPDFSIYSTSWVGPTSDVKAQELVDMDSEELIKLLKEWEPKTEPDGFGPTKEGLGRELGAAVKLKPEYFNNLAEKFKGLDPTYIRSYLQAFEGITQHDGLLNWKQLLELSSWVVEQPREIPGRQGEMMDQDPDWSWTRKTVSSLISEGTNNDFIPYEFRERVWSIIEPLTRDPDPTLADESRREENSDDAYILAINSARGEAMSAVVEYALWVRRCIEKSPGGEEKIKQGFALMPEVKTVLNWHLEPSNDPSIAVRAIYGRFFPWLLLLDRKWTLDNLDRILPPGQFNDRLYAAAWNTMMLYVPAYNDPLEILRDRYFEAVQNLGKVDKKRNRHTDRNEKLAEHLMLFYSRGKIQLSDNLLQEFWKTADDEIRGYALGFVGRSLKNAERDFDAEILKKIKALWESRVAVAKSAKDKTNYEKEMSAFGWWFASGRFGDKWSSDQYLEVLEIGKITQSDYFVVERLGVLVKTLPVETVKILSKMILVDKSGWIISGNRQEINPILSTALQSPEKAAQDEAKTLINRLVARGYADFNNLLNAVDVSVPIEPA